MSFLNLLIEAIFVGIFLIIFFYISDFFMKSYNNIYFTIFLSGFLFHIVSEYSGVNLWYCNLYMSKQK